MVPFQANRFAVFNAEIGARNDHRQEHESESDTVSVGSRHQEGPHQRRRLVLMSSGTVATAVDSPDCHEEIPLCSAGERPVEAVPVAVQDVTAQARITILKPAFMWMQRSILGRRHCGPHLRRWTPHLARSAEEASFCHEERASLPQGSI